MSSLWYISFIDSKNEKANDCFLYIDEIHVHFLKHAKKKQKMKQKHTQERKPDELLLHETKGPVYIR